jgi:hypothetical protein
MDFFVDQRAVDKAAIHLGLSYPVKVRVEGGTYGQYQGLQSGTHIIKAVSWLKPSSANEQIWHELVHAKQAEDGITFHDRPESYVEYRAQPYEREAYDFIPPFPVILPRGENDASDNRMAVPS